MVINKTPHDVNVVDENGALIRTYTKSNSEIRLAVKTERIGNLPDGTPLSKNQIGESQGVPEFEEGTYYIVSQMVQQALPLRKDFLVPAEVVRDAKGVIIGCKSLGV